VTYLAGGRQYVSVLVGYGGATQPFSTIVFHGWKFGAQPRRLLTFALGERHVLPTTAPADATVHAVDDPKLVIDEAQAAVGAALYGRCLICHGGELVSAGTPGPDLRESSAAVDPRNFTEIVKGGALMSRGMPGFEELSDSEVRSLYMYIRAGARKALATAEDAQRRASEAPH